MYENENYVKLTKCNYSEKEQAVRSISSHVVEIRDAVYELKECLNRVSSRMFEDSIDIEDEQPDCNNTLDAQLGLIGCELARCIKVASFINSRLG